MSTKIKNEINNPQNEHISELSAEQFLSKLFSKFDTNSDNRISKFQFAETIKYLTKMTGATLPKRPDIEDIFTYIDIDGDQTITRE